VSLSISPKLLVEKIERKGLTGAGHYIGALSVHVPALSYSKNVHTSAV